MISNLALFMMIERSSYLRIVYETIRRNSVSMMTKLVIYRTGMDPGDKLSRILHQTTRNKLPSLTFLVNNHLSRPVSRKRSRSAGGASQSSSALMTTSDDVDSDDDYVTEQEMDGHDEQDSD
jgi:hypothetical protein